MADILSTLRELRSLEEKRAHGTLSPEEEARFQELQGTVSSRGPKPRAAPSPTPAPEPPPPLAGGAKGDAPAGMPAEGRQGMAREAEEAPFVDADLAEESAEPEPGSSEPTVVQASPAAPEVTAVVPVPAAAEVTTVVPAPAPMESATSVENAVPMSPAELRQWNASFSQPPAPDTVVQAAPSIDLVNEGQPEGEMQPTAGPEIRPEVSPEASPEVRNVEIDEATSVVSLPPEVAMPSVAEWLAAVPPPPAPSPAAVWPAAFEDDSPVVWTDPAAAVPSPAPDVGPAQAGPDLLPSEPATDMEPTRLMLAASSMDPTLADAFEPPADLGSEGAAELTAKRMTPIGEAFAAGESRVVVHTLGGVQKRGSLVDAHMNADFIELRLPDGQRETLSTAGLKAVFFVVPIGQDVPAPVGDPVTVTLVDGHQLIGLSPDYQVGAVGFFLCPTDQRSRTAKIYIYAGAVKGIS